MNSIWNKNIAAFTKRFPSLAQMYSSIIEEINKSEKDTPEQINQLFSFWNIYPAKNNELTADELFENQKLHLHSAYNPGREAENAFVSQKAKSQLIFIGFGLGYHVIKASQLIKEKQLYQKLILIEENPLYFFASLCVLDWTCVFEIENLILAVGCPLDSITQLIETTGHVNLGNEGLSDSHIFTMPAFTAHSKQYSQNLLTLIERNKTKNQINAATFKKFGKLWTNNSRKNLLQIKQRGFVSQIDKSSFSSDFLLVAAGPSLKNILPHMQELKKRMIIVCVETALKALLSVGVEPDFIIITDPQYWAFRHISGLSSKSSVMIAPLSVHPAVFRFPCKDVVLCSDLFWISQFFENRLGSFGDLGAGGSVASSAWNFCYMMGAKNIYLAGLDLSYPSKQTHIKGSSAEQRYYCSNSRLSSQDKMSVASMYSANPEYGLSYSKDKVLTDSRMKMFAWWFESRIASCKDVKTHSLCEQSMQIPAVDFIQAEEAISKTSERNFEFRINKSPVNNFDQLCKEFEKEAHTNPMNLQIQ